MTKLCLFTGWLSSLVPVKETLNSPAYQDILDKFMIPTLWEQLGEDPFLFQYDCVPVMDEQVWCGKIWPAGTESWPQSDRMLLGWIRVETVSQALSSNISVWPHVHVWGCAYHKHSPKTCGKPHQKSHECVIVVKGGLMSY